MRAFTSLSAFFALLFTAGSGVAQVNDGQWVSYRDAYRAMVAFEKYGKSKHFIQNHFQVMPQDKNLAPEGLQLSLQGKGTSVNLPLDATGRTVFPLLKSAYDENAALVLNRKVSQYVFRPRISIVVRADGVYETGDLRSACEEALAYQRTVDATLRALRCTGVRFVFARGMVDPGVRVRKGEGEALTTQDGPAFPGDPYEGFRVVTYRFSAAGEKSHVVTQNAPLAINPIYE
ncbi:hypothetical protein [Massilia sp. TSP1-1-2]|uniref:hypothetical protein n=1 Tax=Massilia sp. TSP1-1-2 TaxID=2804649 RepID=UPI003CF573AF